MKIKEEEQNKILKCQEKNKPRDEELEVCAYIQDCIVKNGGDSKWLGFYKNSGSYIEISYLYSVLKFKFAKKGKYVIVEKTALSANDYKIEPCTMSEGGADYVRVYFNHPFELEPLIPYFYNVYSHCRKSALEYFKYHKHYESEHKKSPAMLNALSASEVAVLLESAEKRRYVSNNCDTVENLKLVNVKMQISRKDVMIQPIHNRVPLSNIRNKNNWEKGFDEGYPLWEQGDSLRKKGDFESAIRLFEQARYNGYDAPALYTSYAMAYRKLKDYDNEIDILDEGIEREGKQGVDVGKLTARRDKAIQLFLKQQESRKKNRKA